MCFEKRPEWERTGFLIGDEGLRRLHKSRVAIFGIGGVGGHAAEALARSGVGSLDFIDNDKVTLSNINRQVIALHSTVGKDKTEVMRERALDINPELKIRVCNCFFLPENSAEFDFTSYDYVIDAVDTVTAKLEIVRKAKEAGIPVISCMGAGNKLDPVRFEITDIYQTQMCPLARVMRRELKKRGIEHLKVVYSKEPALKSPQGRVPGSIAFVPSAAGLIAAGEVIKDIAFARNCGK